MGYRAFGGLGMVNGYTSDATRPAVPVGELSLGHPQDFGQDFTERYSREAEMIAQQEIELNCTTTAFYDGEDTRAFVEYRGPTAHDWWRKSKL